MEGSLRIILSICIPTYNRASFLKEAIESVLSQVNPESKDKIEIVISDNASEDDTPEVVKEFRKKSLVPINYSRTGVNLGNDRNFLRVVELARGEYCWLLGDDDQLTQGAIGKILKEIEGNPGVDVFLGNREDYDITLTHRFRFVPVLKKSGECIFDFGRIEALSYLKSVRKLTGIFSYISSLVFKREKWMRIPDKEKFIGTANVHVYVFMAMLWGGRRGVLKYLPNKIVKTRWRSDRPFLEKDIYERAKMEAECFRSFAQEVFDDPRLVREVDNLVLRNDGFSWAVRARIAGRFQFYRRVVPFFLKYYWSYPLFWSKIFPIFFIPSFILRVARWWYRKFVKWEPVGFAEIFE